MANPTTNRPARPVFNSGLGFGATCKSFVDCAPTSGMPIELVSNTPGRPWEGVGGYGTGFCPRNKATGFPYTPDGGSPCLKFGYGSPEIRFMGRGFATGDGVARTMAVVARIDYLHPPGVSSNYGLCLVGQSSRGVSPSLQGITVRTANSGHTIETVTGSGGSLPMDAPVTYTTGHWYAIAISTDQTASPFAYRIQAYNYTTQTLGALLSKTSTTATGLPASSDLCIGGYLATDVFGGPFRGLIACAILDKQYWDATLFQNFYQDPWATVRGTYTPSGGLTAPSFGYFTHGEGGCQFAFGPATGTGTGGTGSPTYHLQRYTDLTAAPSTGARVVSNITPDAGGAIINVKDTTAATGTIYGYRLECVDGSSTVYYPASNQTPLQGWRRASGVPLLINFAGDSRTENKSPGMSPASGMLSRRLDRPINYINAGHSGTYAYQWTVGVNGRNTISITGTPTSGTFTIGAVLTGGSSTTFRNIPYNCTAALMKTILEDNTGTYTNAVPNGSNTAGIGGPGNVTCSGGPLPGTPIVIDFNGPTSSKKNNNVTLGTNALNNSATVTVTGTYIGAAPDANCWTAAWNEFQAALTEDPDCVPWWHCAVGTNDANGTLQQVVDYQRYLQANIAYFQSNGVKCVYSPPPMLRNGSGATNFNTPLCMETLRQFGPALQAIADGVTCFYTGNRMNSLSIMEPLGSTDGLHGFANGPEAADERMGWADGLYNAINPSSGGGGGGGSGYVIIGG